MHDSYSSQNIYAYFHGRRKQVAAPWTKDSKNQGFKASGIQGLKDSNIQKLNASCLGTCSKHNHTRFSRTQSLDPPRAKHTKTPVPKHWSANIDLDKFKNYLQHKTTKEKTKMTPFWTVDGKNFASAKNTYLIRAGEFPKSRTPHPPHSPPHPQI